MFGGIDLKVFGKTIDEIGFYFICFMCSVYILYYESLNFVIPYVSKYKLLYMVSGVLLILLVYKYFIQKDKFIKIKFFIPIFSYIIFVFLSAIFSKYKEISFLGFVQRKEGFISILSYIIMLIATYSFINKKNIKNLFVVLFIFSGIASVIGLLEFFGVNPLLQAFRLNKEGFGAFKGVYSTIGNQNFISSFMCMLTLISLILFVLYEGRIKMLYYIFYINSFIFLLIAKSRSGWIGIIIGICIFLVVLGKNIINRNILLSLIIIFITSISAINILNKLSNNQILSKVDSIKSDLTSVVEEEKKQEEKDLNRLGSNRYYIWSHSLPLIKKYFLIGSGPDTFIKVFPQDKKKALKYYGDEDIKVDKAHNEYLQIIVTNGIFSFASYMIFIFGIISLNIKNIMKNGIMNNSILIATFIAILGYQIQAFFNISVIQVAPFYYMIIGINLSLLLKEDSLKDNNLITEV